MKRDHGKKIPYTNIDAGRAVESVIKSCLGPRAMLKMMMDPMGGTVLTNDGNAILREITVEHPTAKSMLEIARTQDEEVGDGTTSVIIIAGEVLAAAAPCLQQEIHPTIIIKSFRQALEDMLTFMERFCCKTVDTSDSAQMLSIVKTCLGTKFINKWLEMACEIAMKAVQRVAVPDVSGESVASGGFLEIDIKRNVRVEKIVGGSVDDCELLDGLMFAKELATSSMRKRIEQPRIILMDCDLEYKKGESHTNFEFMQENDMYRALKIEEEYIERITDEVLRLKPDLFLTEKNVSDYAQHFLQKAGVTVIRRVRKPDMLRMSRACGATIVHRTEELQESDVGTECGLFQVRVIGSEEFVAFTKCRDPKACTVILRGASKDVLNELDRNLGDAMNVARNVMMERRLVPGGGAVEMAMAEYLRWNSRNLGNHPDGIHPHAYVAIAEALEIIPRILLENCGAKVLRTITDLKAKHEIQSTEKELSEAPLNITWGIDGHTGQITDMNELKVWDPLQVKSQVFKTGVEAAIMLLRIDDIVSGSKKQNPV